MPLVGGLAQYPLFNVERTVLAFGRDDDERYFAADFTKVVCATKNAERRRVAGRGQRGDTAKNDLSLVEVIEELAFPVWCHV